MKNGLEILEQASRKYFNNESGVDNLICEAGSIIEKEFTRLQNKIEKLRKALKKYGCHSNECLAEKYPEAWHCICGLSKAEQI